MCLIDQFKCCYKDRNKQTTIEHNTFECINPVKTQFVPRSKHFSSRL